MLLNATQIIRDQSEQQSILIAIEDVTEKWKKNKAEKALAEELEKMVFDRTFSLQEANMQLLLSNENLAQFAYIASHDLQEPLRKIQTFSSMLQDKYYVHLPGPVKQIVAKITISSERMSVLIKELLNFSKVLHSQTVFEKTDLEKVLDNVIADFDLLIAEKNVVINREPLPVIDAVPFQINQLFYNLISNAIKFSKTGIAPVISITFKKLSVEEMAKMVNINPNYAYFEIGIKDNGIGFDQQYEEQIFVVFNRLHSQDKYAGTGIGLALCKKIINNHSGELYAVSKENEGTLFSVILPLTR